MFKRSAFVSPRYFENYDGVNCNSLLRTGLATELLIGRYSMPTPADPSSLLARHEAGLFEEARRIMADLGMRHRSNGFNRLILPLCQPIVEAIGHRMAYEAAVKAKVDPNLLALFVAAVIKHDFSWYVEHLELRRRQQQEMEDRALEALLPKLEQLLEATNVKSYCLAPIVSDQAWDKFVESLPCFKGEADLEMIPGTKSAPVLRGRTASHL